MDRQLDRSIVGLLGELLFLQKVVGADPRLLPAWLGPTKARHDFRRGSSAVEVKTTLRSNARDRRVHVSDIDQLEPPEGGQLHLYLARLERAMSGPISAKGLSEEISSKLLEADVSTFWSLLSDFESGPDWAAGFELREEIAYSVKPGFPCLTKGHLITNQLDTGVARVSYDLSLEAATAFECPIDAAIRSLIGAGA